MRKNEYTSLEDFYREYCNKTSDEYETYIGLDFEYREKKYRLCLEPIGKYYLYRVDDNQNSEMPLFEIIGVFDNLNDVLESCVIDNRAFSEIIMDDNTIITGKD